MSFSFFPSALYPKPSPKVVFNKEFESWTLSLAKPLTSKKIRTRKTIFSVWKKRCFSRIGGKKEQIGEKVTGKGFLFRFQRKKIGEVAGTGGQIRSRIFFGDF